MSNILISIKKFDHYGDNPLPTYATIGSAGLDLFAALSNETMIINHMQRLLVPTGLAISLPIGFEAQIRPRSGLAIKHGVTVTNAPGTIDSDYRGEIFVSLINLNNEPFTITSGMRIAQMVIAKYEKINWNLVETLDDTERGNGAFGSTGV